tara:strand:+ start:1335 stop:3191 length:1857 start_codon:yes stop_codon:yes gene_type:complete
MCGIFGFYNLKDQKNSRIVLEEMGDALYHRGPDSNGFYLNDQVGLGIQRLKIIDLKTGDQPIYSNNKRFVIVFNGEIYNYIELKNELIRKGYNFYTNSDTEVIVNLFQEEGENSFIKLNGMFSFAIYDLIKKNIIICRDRNGIKPLYYYYEDKVFVFSSEIKSLKKHPNIKLSLNFSAVDLYLTMESIPAPLSIYNEINKLEEGSYLIANGRNLEIKKWHKKKYYPKIRTTFKDAVNNVDQLIQNSLKITARSDVQLGSFLSSGIDSSILSYYFNKNFKDKLKTFSVGFESKTFDESKDAKEIASLIGSDHQELILSNKDILENTFKIIDNLDEPFADPSIIPTTLLSKYVKNFVKVAICGDGGDEIFGGYPTYMARHVSNYLPNKILSKLNFFNYVIPTSNNYLTFEYKIKKFFRDLNYEADLRHMYWMGSFNYNQKKELFKHPLNESNISELVNDKINKTNIPNNWERSLYLDNCFYLINNNLYKSDTASMMHSLELRVPFLDNELVNYVNCLPLSFKYKFMNSKPLLRKITQNKLPSIYKKSKKGFGVPISEMINKEMKDMICDTILNNKGEFHNIFQKKYIVKILNDHFNQKHNYRKEIWTLFILSNWFLKNHF